MTNRALPDEAVPSLVGPMLRAVHEPDVQKGALMLAPARTENLAVKQGHVGSIDLLRALASIAVCWFHLTGSTGPATAPLRLSGLYGEFGVQAFFVVSGFVIPYSLHRSSYTPSSFFRFLGKRLIRIDPPYLASIVLALGLLALRPYMPSAHATFQMPPLLTLLAHIGYAVPLLHEPMWISPVYWTLAIEFQYYLLIALIHPLLSSKREDLAFLASAALVVAGFLFPQKGFFPTHASYFILGTYAFRYKVGLSSGKVTAVVVALATAAALFGHGLPPTVAALAATLTIFAGWHLRHPIAQFFSNISYSLYLIHWHVGMLTVATLNKLHLVPPDGWVVRLGAFAIVVAGSYAFYRAIEVPAQRLASRIKLRPS